ncbi:MAG TPA: DUF4428 domain-containing protein [Clostridiaceae bacterium]|jgi:hypothetical protein|nr:DUF4428 domain-containing protein [Clostridiaceae bacterium]
MGLFDRKICDICGGKCGLLGGKKVKDGRLCSDCAKKQSPYLPGRKNFTVEEMKQHLEDRERNQEMIDQFAPTRTIGQYLKLYIDDERGLWFVTSARRYQEVNPDIFQADQVLGARVDVDRNEREVVVERAVPASAGNPGKPEVKKTVIEYDFYINIDVAHPWVNQMHLKVNRSSIENTMSHDYREADRDSKAIVAALLAMRDGSAVMKQEAARPKQRVICPNCGATTMPDDNNCCEYCMGALGSS